MLQKANIIIITCHNYVIRAFSICFRSQSESVDFGYPKKSTALRPSAVVVASLTGDAGSLTLGTTTYATSPGSLRLRSGSRVSFTSSDDEEQGWSICLTQSCEHFVCPPPYLPVAPGSFCSDVLCSSVDVEHCCTTEKFGELNGPIWSHSFHSLLDLSLPPSRWLQDALPRLVHPRTQLLVCISQDVFRDLCTAHVEQALELGFRSTTALSVNTVLALDFTGCCIAP